MDQIRIGKCVYILKTTKKLYKIGKTKNLIERIAAYKTHMPSDFKVIRQYHAENMDELEQNLHVVFQHKRIKGEWFQLTKDDLEICDNIFRNFALEKTRKGKPYPQIRFINNPQLQVMEANEKYLRDYSRIVEEIKLGLSTNEIFESMNGEISKTTIQTVRKILQYKTPNSDFLIKWAFVVEDLEAGLTIDQVRKKYNGKITKATIQTIRRILRNQLY
ncbi:GIY-YIG nuclease family protein [Flexithrix dorotheae]|uniref:GIY-YIG nuclease family protein n=1 Tax=Flexithrix dorotheae TaxID=70993 RepID=UPI00037E562A|nr:GIY-YIG nuclease family protein [Flexithrix dorotheae]